MVLSSGFVVWNSSRLGRSRTARSAGGPGELGNELRSVDRPDP